MKLTPYDQLKQAEEKYENARQEYFHAGDAHHYAKKNKKKLWSKVIETWDKLMTAKAEMEAVKL